MSEAWSSNSIELEDGYQPVHVSHGVEPAWSLDEGHEAGSYFGLGARSGNQAQRRRAPEPGEGWEWSEAIASTEKLHCRDAEAGTTTGLYGEVESPVEFDPLESAEAGRLGDWLVGDLLREWWKAKDETWHTSGLALLKWYCASRVNDSMLSGDWLAGAIDQADPKLALGEEIWTHALTSIQSDFEYGSRIEELKFLGQEDGLSANRASERNFWEFIRLMRFSMHGQLFLLDSGNLRAVWTRGAEEHFGVEFLGNDVVQYVIFKRRARDQAISRVSGCDSFVGVRKQIHAFELQSMLYAA